MPLLFPAIIFVNDNISDNIQAMLVRQLYITDVLDGYVFDENTANDSNYPANLKLLNKRALVKITFQTQNNREFADVVCFASNGLIAVLKNKVGPPERTFSIVNLDWNKLLLGA